MLFKEDIEQSLRSVFTNLAVDGDTIRALTELYNSLPSSEVSLPVRGLDIDIIPDDRPKGENDFLAYKSTKHELQDLADELNEVEPIDWEDNNQAKIFIEYHHIANRLVRGFAYSCRGLNIYSTNVRFLEIAKERIGEDRLIKLFKEGI